MKYAYLSVFLVIFVLINAENTNLFENNNIRIKPLISGLADKTNINFYSGVFGNTDNRQYYSMINAGFKKTINNNWSFSYNLGYSTFNMNENYLTGGMGVRYHNDNFSMSLYLQRSFETEPMFNFSRNINTVF